MDVESIKKIVSKDEERRNFIEKTKNYYENKGDIKSKGIVPDGKDPLRAADNRISHNYHQLLVNEKAAYMFTYPVIFNVDSNKEINKKVLEVLGDDFESVSQDLCIESSNTGIAWLHYWINDTEKIFNYALVPTEQVIPIYSSSLKKEVIEVYRYYKVIEKSKEVLVFEHWTAGDFSIYKINIENTDFSLLSKKTIKHSLGRVPFIPFLNNRKGTSDLNKYKDLIDLYDRVMSGFANDLEDIQQIIYILENYGGTDLGEFKSNLKKFKAIKVESGVTGNGGGVNTMQIEIPVEARKLILDILKKQIYESGQGLQQDTESFGNASGVALKFFYRKLELKAGFSETEFKKGFGALIRAILKFLNKDTNLKITQTYTRNMISNDLENSEIARNSVGILPDEIIIRNHPWVEDVEEVLNLLEKEKTDVDPYENKEKTLNE
ncbi:phage portal protein [Clostridium chrysemydis]|uniref:phage portal protein n=1 Tax=Clostridium chrysemydis TaxID=2665504 RepID=UPI003F343969